jgi:hypothetical protein
MTLKITKNAAYKKTPLLFKFMSTPELISFSESCNKTRSDMEVNNLMWCIVYADVYQRGTKIINKLILIVHI